MSHSNHRHDGVESMRHSMERNSLERFERSMRDHRYNSPSRKSTIKRSPTLEHLPRFRRDHPLQVSINISLSVLFQGTFIHVTDHQNHEHDLNHLLMWKQHRVLRTLLDKGKKLLDPKIIWEVFAYGFLYITIDPNPHIKNNEAILNYQEAQGRVKC